MEGSPPSIYVYTENKVTKLCSVELEKGENSVPGWLLLPRILSILEQDGIAFDFGAVALKNEKGEFIKDNQEIQPDSVVYLTTTKENRPPPCFNDEPKKGITYQGIFLEIPEDLTKDQALAFACNAFGLDSFKYRIDEGMLLEVKRDVACATIAYGGKLHTVHKTDTAALFFYVPEACKSVCKLLCLDPEKYWLLGGTSSLVEPYVTYTLTTRTGLKMLRESTPTPLDQSFKAPLSNIKITFGDKLAVVFTRGEHFLLTRDVLESVCSQYGLRMDEYYLDTKEMVILAGETCKLIKR